MTERHRRGDDPPIVRRRRRTRRLIAASAVTMVLVLSGCGGVVGSLVSTRQAIAAAGYTRVSVGIAGTDSIKVSATVDQDASQAEVTVIEAIVWRDVHQRFGALDLTLHAADRTLRGSVPFALLQEELGARPASDNRTTLRSGIIRIGIEVLVGVAVVIAVVVTGVVVLVRARRRRATGLPSAPRRRRGGGGGSAPGVTTGWGPPVPAPSPAGPAPGAAHDPWAPSPDRPPPPW